MPRTVLSVIVFATSFLCSVTQCSVALPADGPRSHDPRIVISLFAEHPEIVTPTGIDVDSRGRVWAVESNTHFPPENYAGHPTDRVLVLVDTDGDGRSDPPRVFVDGLVHTMSVAVLPPWLNLPDTPGKPPPTVVFLATRREIFRCIDHDGDLVCDEKTSLVHLETEGNYPHNGLAGFAFSPLGQLFFGFGENLGADYRIVGSDGTALSGGGEGGNIYRIQPDGSQLARWATGFWNPHANTFDAQGRLFSVDNDADSRPPCRLMHIVRGGDYGYRYRNGRKGLHPFTSWNGEIPGTLPMAAGTGEAPSGVLACGGDAFPPEYRQRLLVTSWGDHRIDSFEMKPVGASVMSVAQPLISGGQDFRPVGIASAPDGSLYCTDWVLRDYKLHRHGRVWRIAPKIGPAASPVDVDALMAATPAEWTSPTILEHPRIDVRRTAARLLVRTSEGRNVLKKQLMDSSPSRAAPLEALWALASTAEGRTWLVGQSSRLLNDADPLLAEAFAWLASDIQLEIPQSLLTERLHVIRELGPGEARPGLQLALLAGLNCRSVDEIAPECNSRDPFLFSMAVNRLAQAPEDELIRVATNSRTKSSLEQLAAILAARQQGIKDSGLLRQALAGGDPQIVRAAVQWAAEERWTELRPALEAVLNTPHLSSDVFLAVLAGLELFDGVPPAEFDKTPPAKYVLPLVLDAQRPAPVRAMALRLVAPTDPQLTSLLLNQLLSSADPALRREAVWTLCQSPLPDAGQLLRSVIEGSDAPLRLDAIAGLAGPVQREPQNGGIRQLLAALIRSRESHDVRREALRSSRLVDNTDLRQAAEALVNSPGDGLLEELREQAVLTLGMERPALSPAAWREKLAAPDASSDGQPTGDPEAGRRLFYHSKGPGCSNCHTVNGRGGKIGPDLSTIGQSSHRNKLIDSLLDPSREIAPQFVSWVLETQSGQVLTGMIVFENEGRLTLGTAEGTTREISTSEIVDRRPQQLSVMPEKLADRMTVQEFRDLLAWLQSLK